MKHPFGMQQRAPNLTPNEIEYLQNQHGANDLDIDIHGNIINKYTGQIVAPYRDAAAVQEDIDKEIADSRAELKTYFDGLPNQVKVALLKDALNHKVDIARKKMESGAHPLVSEKWGISYEEMAKLTAEGILLSDE